MPLDEQIRHYARVPTTPEDERQTAVVRVREHLDRAYRPLFEEYLATIPTGDDERMVDLAEKLSDAVDVTESPGAPRRYAARFAHGRRDGTGRCQAMSRGCWREMRQAQ